MLRIPPALRSTETRVSEPRARLAHRVARGLLLALLVTGCGRHLPRPSTIARNVSARRARQRHARQLAEAERRARIGYECRDDDDRRIHIATATAAAAYELCAAAGFEGCRCAPAG
ncbi:MAG TPA: hypothetical protein RMH85_17805 [Polyangiaceae bacterium LLY-WYZ-15_(1-7)]|nr:hypothetical protein [Polyangiaceae bacterium LLY-WYZ-15_(1-7)]HJL10360.1 hypothetical protein [Polyangiaceae bacterium LLY-WYZ-15_(1-7)]HJL23954.1 hypothetical protein [Polyangiaceae bacterium LLY-WYZ-15_(1-7)]HJL39205.1 hypothetical protein [Polyangiaceae bacterium LLY-WYZ-15_(1-7)]HJL45222.1 hypothetical protein [Polyangiaceae bacterium LLY-WYZ-15_(1-7)]